MSASTALLAIALSGLVAPAPSAAQSLSVSERETLVRLHADRGGRAEDIDALIRVADEAASKGLPVGEVTNKIREGLAKGADTKRIEVVIRQMATHLETADRLIREVDSAAGGAGRETAVSMLAESLGSGVMPDEVRDLGRLAQTPGKPPMSAESLASAAKGLSLIKASQLPVADAAAVIAEAVRQGFRSHEILDLGREVRRREADYRAGRASLRALRDAIARGDRPDQLFRDSRITPAERPAATRPETVDRPDRPSRPDVPQRPEPPERPEAPGRGRDR